MLSPTQFKSLRPQCLIQAEEPTAIAGHRQGRKGVFPSPAQQVALFQTSPPEQDRFGIASHLDPRSPRGIPRHPGERSHRSKGQSRCVHHCKPPRASSKRSREDRQIVEDHNVISSLCSPQVQVDKVLLLGGACLISSHQATASAPTGRYRQRRSAHQPGGSQGKTSNQNRRQFPANWPTPRGRGAWRRRAPYFKPGSPHSQRNPQAPP